MAATNGADRANVFHGDGLTSAGVVGDGEHDQRNALATDALNKVFKRLHIHVAFEGVHRRRLAALGNHEVDGFGADKFHVGASGVEVGVVGNDVALFAGDAEEDALGGAALVGGNHVRVAADVLDGFAKAVKAGASGIALVAAHDGGPLAGRHGSGAGIGEQIDEHVVGRK